MAGDLSVEAVVSMDVIGSRASTTNRVRIGMRSGSHMERLPQNYIWLFHFVVRVPLSVEAAL